MRLTEQYQERAKIINDLYILKDNIEACMVYISYKRESGEEDRSFMQKDFLELVEKRCFVMERLEIEENKLKELDVLLDMIDVLDTNLEGAK